MVSGTVFEIDQKGAYLDIGAKSAAFCPHRRSVPLQNRTSTYASELHC